MEIFRYQAFNANGKTERGELEAENAVEAQAALKRQGLRIQSLESKFGKDSRSKSIWTLEMRRPNYQRLFADLSLLMTAGLGFDRALKTLAAGNSIKGNKSVIERLLVRIEGGRSPSQAFSDIDNLRSDVVALVASGEQSGRLAQVFLVLAADFEKQNEQKRLLTEALAYPIFLLIMTFLTVLLITYVLVPAIVPIFEGSNRQLPIVIRVLNAVGEISLVDLALAIIAVLSGGLLIKYALRSSSRQFGLENLSAKTPFFGPLQKKYGVARYLQSLSLLLENGVDVQRALALSTACSPTRSLLPALEKVHELVLSGLRLPAAFAEVGIFPPAVVSLATVGDEVNKLPDVLSKAAAILQSEVMRTIDRCLIILTPAITIILGLLVGSLVVSVMSALLSINELSVQ